MSSKLDFYLSKLSKILEKLGLKKERPPLEKYYIYFLLFFIAFLMAHFAVTFVRSKILSEGGVRTKSQKKAGFSLPEKRPSVLYGITQRNIFNGDHLIPSPYGSDENGFEEKDGIPVPSKLPLKLLGTIIHSYRDRSVAAVQVSGKDVKAVVKDDKVNNLLKVHEISRYKMVFRNLRSRKLEFIEIKEEDKLKIGVKPSGKSFSKKSSSDSSELNFTLKRADIDKHLKNLPRLLQDAKVDPYIIPGSGGEVGGYTFTFIKSGSVYEKILEFKKGDIIQGVNGETVNNPQKAMELFQMLKNTNEISLEVRRNGEIKTFNYTLE